MNPFAFRSLANELATTPAAYRSAVSRAYDAAYHSAADLVRAAGVLVRKRGESHGYVRLLFSSAGQVDMELVATGLARLHADRIDADYELADRTAESEGTALANVDWSLRVISAVRRLGAAPTFDGVKAALTARDHFLKTGTPPAV